MLSPANSSRIYATPIFHPQSIINAELTKMLTKEESDYA
ncbi:hypothetical protein COO91_08017 [Nostoc flagelliforme CCNUN1]|uniref:Uncharacterized protein n=1 Tax=Nostoc flagelliforme CCNUN1 TaxID=2038116 RepID=A0A2K8T2K2_9NOSO|nr:hypothetical protein COO91_08017 [Nostoc flagelliforme CCNUN1]